MKLLILGATGHTGRELVRQALTRGHSVTAFVRSPTKLEPTDGLSIVPGALGEPAGLCAALSGHDALLSALGPHPREAFRPSTLLTDCMRTTIQAMRTAGVARLGVVSAAVLFDEPGWYFAFFRWLLRHHARDLRGMEGLLQASGLSFTIARPPRLVHSAERGFRAAALAMPEGSRSMSYAALAAFLLDAIEGKSHVGEVVGLGPALEPARPLLGATRDGTAGGRS
jgi:putative NADH-flavin reductase